MNVDYQILFNIAFTVSAFLAGWVLSRVTRALDQIDADVRLLPEKYVSKADYRADLHEIKELLKHIDQKLDRKADK
jgi:cell shape-determining protein MreC